MEIYVAKFVPPLLAQCMRTTFLTREIASSPSAVVIDESIAKHFGLASGL